MKKNKKMGKPAKVETTGNEVDLLEREVLAEILVAGEAREKALYQKEVDALRGESKRKPKCKTRKTSEPKPYILISGAVARALMDNRSRKLPDNLATAIAIRAKEESARQKIRWLPMAPSKGWRENLAIAALEGNEQFFRDLADSFFVLREQGFSVDSAGKWTKKTADFKGKKYMLSHWKSWEKNAVPMKLRAIELQEKFGLSRKDFYKFAHILRSEPKSPM